MLGKTEGRRRRVDRGWDGWMASPTQWAWVSVNSGSSWRTGRPGVLQSMGSQRVGHDWATKLNWTDIMKNFFYSVAWHFIILLVSLFLTKILNLLIFLKVWLCWVFSAVWGLSLVAMHWLLTVVASLEAEQRFWKARALVVVDTGSVVAAHGLSCPAVCGIFPD